MKKLFIFAVTAAALAACSSEELNVQDTQKPVSQEAPVQFDVYAQRSVNTRGGTPGTNNNENIGTRGFGVFAYYTMGEQYDTKATPNFMYNQKVTCTGTAAAGTLWTYEPVKYWPNEYGNAAVSDDVDYVTFFAYAPWTDIEPTTGNIIPTEPTTANPETVEHQQKYNIISVNKNSAQGDPIIKYVVDTDPATSVDLLWGVAAETAGDNYSPITNSAKAVTPGKPFIDLVKPNNPAEDRLQFNLKHALAKVKVTIDYIDDANTPTGPAAAKLNKDETRIYVRSFTMSGLATQGALNLNNTDGDPGEPLWKDYDGRDLAFGEVTFQDGRKDGKEGDVNGAQNNETPQGLNPEIVENYAATSDGKFGTEKKPGVTTTPQLLFGGTADDNNGGYFYVIPRNTKGASADPVNVTIVYDVETIDKNLAGLLSDGATHGLSTENIISKNNIFKGVDFEAGKQYLLKIHLGMTSVKIEATVTDWVENGETHVDLPDNQQPAAVTALNYKYTDYTTKGTFTTDGNTVNYKIPSTSLDQDCTDDLARFLGALYRAANVSKITYESKDYTWDPEKAGNLKGSNWVDSDGNTLVSTIVTALSSSTPPLTVTIKADNETITINVSA